ncbi:uncharacterized protein RCC_11536 [Ramularia collo-cygni]|uniref:Uncharacterized protein n=1 Tax=Ramularia collo-cygni TaxID=112498 RepID=A0A2D3VJU6_9PEZI|nr:uncharacterized protein RCC_11536 [Ramularia collo-cygni]CZT25867.1 uncharacterized protein RCC_11536 [Ramularia collo-cygni]
MSSSSYKRRTRLAEETEASRFEIAPYLNCRKAKRPSLRVDVERIEEEEIKLKMRKVRLRKQLRLVERRTDDAVVEELDKLEEAKAVEAHFLSSEIESGIEVSDNPFIFSDVLKLTPKD